MKISGVVVEEIERINWEARSKRTDDYIRVKAGGGGTGG